MREEPVIYINGNPYVVREANKPFANLEYTGASYMVLHTDSHSSTSKLLCSMMPYQYKGITTTIMCQVLRKLQCHAFVHKFGHTDLHQQACAAGWI